MADAQDPKGHDHDHDHAHHHEETEHAPDKAEARSHEGEAHDHDHVRSAPARKLAIALGLTASFMFVEVAAGLLSHSLALLSDAGHMLTDAGALALALVAQRLATRPRTARQTFGFRRAETLAALANGIALGISSLWVVLEALRRWNNPPEIQGGAMLVVAFIGLLINLASAWVLSSGEHGHNTNVRAALAHVLADAAGSVAAMVAGALVVFLGWRRADPAVSILISGLIVWAAWRLITHTVDVLMESTPAGLKLDAVEATIRQTPGVAQVHDLHAWNVADGFPVVTVHVVLTGERHGTDVAREVAARIEKEHQITHVTVQPEAPATEGFVSVASLTREKRRGLASTDK